VNRRDYAAAFRHLGDRYIQHNPNAADGLAGFREFFNWIEKQYPKFRVEIKRVFVEGDMVALQCTFIRRADQKWRSRRGHLSAGRG
jgi:predicted SnoaL-like aldol condensation-catalyzing enzyme